MERSNQVLLAIPHPSRKIVAIKTDKNTIELSIDHASLLLMEKNDPNKADKISVKSEAVFEIIKNMSGIWKILLFFKILPKKWLDVVYSFISKHRTKISKIFNLTAEKGKKSP